MTVVPDAEQRPASQGSVPPRRVLLLQWLVVALMAALAITLAAFAEPRHNVDQRIYHGAIQWWLDGQPLYEYFRYPNERLGFSYPPFAAICMLPMALLTVNQTLVIGISAIVAATVALTWWLVRPVAARHGWPRWFAAALAVPAVFVLEPVRENVAFGQVNMFLLALILVDLAALRRGSKWAGIGIGLVTAIKLTPGFFVLYLLVTRQWRAAFMAVGVAVGATLGAVALAPATSWQFWTETLWQTRRVGSIGLETNQSLAGLLVRLQNDDVVPQLARPNLTVWIVASLLVLAIGLWRARQAHQAGDELTAFTLAGITAGLLSPISWSHHLIWIVPAVLILLDHGCAASTRRAAAKYFVVAGAAVIVFASGVHHRFWHPGGHHYDDGVVGVLGGNAYVLACLALLLLVPVRALVWPAASHWTGGAPLVRLEA
jgi:alpha-1,2-mannosyltransferase